MIKIIEGRIGGGKTYSATEIMAEHLAAGGSVYSNIEVNFKGMKKLVGLRFGCDVDPDQINLIEREDVQIWYNLIRWGVYGQSVLVVIDEAQLFYNSRDFKKTYDEHKGMLEFLTQSRKAWVDLIFITQIASNIDKQFRDLAQFRVEIRDMAHIKFPIFGTLLKNYFAEITFDYANSAGGRAKVLSSRFKRKETLVYNAYDSYAFLSPEMEAIAKKHRADAIKKRSRKRISYLQRLKLYFSK